MFTATRLTGLAALTLSAGIASADVNFTPLIGDMGPGADTINFNQLAVGTHIPGQTPVYPPNSPTGLAVPGHPVVLQGSMAFNVANFDDWFPGSVVPGLWEGHGMFNPAGSGVNQGFQVHFAEPVSAAGLVLFNNFGTTERFYGLRVYDSDGNIIGDQSQIGVQATPEFMGFKSDEANIALLELLLPITFNTGARPFFDTITYQAGGGTDSDGDGVPDDSDSCVQAANPDQTDSDGDGYGNACDADVNNDCVVNAQDLGALRAGFFGSDPVLDFNGDGDVNAIDLGIMRLLFFAAPGPSGISNTCN